MATVTKPLALNESLNSTENTPRNIADVLADELDGIKQAINNQSGSGNGHIIQNSSGANMPSENTMQFVDAHLSDDNVGGKTKVETFKAVTESEYSSETEDGAYIITDGDGATIGPVSEDYVEVTGDGEKTRAQLLTDLDALVDWSKVNENSYIVFGNDIYRVNVPNVKIFMTSAISGGHLYNTMFDLKYHTSQQYDTTSNGSTLTDNSSAVPTSGRTITLYYGNKKATVDLQTTANRCLMADGRTVQTAAVIDISDKFSVSNDKLRVSAQKNGKRITLSVSGYDGTFNNGEYITINDPTLYPNVADGTLFGGGMALNNTSPQTYTHAIGYKGSNFINIYYSQSITADVVQLNVVYDIA